MQMEQPHFFSGPSGRLEARVSNHEPLKTAKRIGIICHPHPLYQGTMDNKVVTTMAKAWAALGLTTIRFNFRGVGESEGEYGNVQGEIDDLRAVLAEVKTINPTASLWLAGFSFGSFIAFSVASEQKDEIKALLTIAPPIHHNDFRSSHLPSCPWVIIHGEEDELIALDKVQAWYNQVKTQKNDTTFISIPKASHFFHGQLIVLNEIIQDKMKPFIT